jgi:hypothetical protein
MSEAYIVFLFTAFMIVIVVFFVAIVLIVSMVLRRHNQLTKRVEGIFSRQGQTEELIKDMLNQFIQHQK